MELFITLVIVGVLFFCFGRKAIHFLPSQEKTWLSDYHYAHRGLHTDFYPENSLPAFQNAVQNGYAIETDVRLSKDGVIMVFHDSTLLRMTGKAGNLKDYSYAQLRHMHLKGTVYTIPTLEEVLHEVNGQVPLLIEIKNKSICGILEKKLYALLQNYKGNYAVQSFSPFSIRWFRRHAPQVFRGQLAGDFNFCEHHFSKITRFFVTKILMIIQRLCIFFICKPNFISYEFHTVDTRLIRRLRSSGATIFAWTIRTAEQYTLARPYIDSAIFEDFKL
ncbi:MAG: glycerophosphodiester phosphodiesterase family protein [Christensenellaceae bacterium]